MRAANFVASKKRSTAQSNHDLLGLPGRKKRGHGRDRSRQDSSEYSSVLQNLFATNADAVNSPGREFRLGSLSRKTLSKHSVSSTQYASAGQVFEVGHKSRSRVVDLLTRFAVFYGYRTYARKRASRYQ